MKYYFWIIIAALIFLQAIAYILWRIAFKSPNKTQNNDHFIGDSEQIKPISDKVIRLIDEMNAIPYETAEIISFDGYKLHGRLYVENIDAPFIICCHGFRGTPSRDFCGGFKVMRDLGMNLLLIEQRAHKSSEGTSITMGVKERKDCVDWINYLIKRFGSDQKIVLCGISMGAATVLMTSGMKLPHNVKGIIADSPYTSPKSIVLKVLKQMKLPSHLCYLFLTIGSWLFGDFNLNDLSADAEKAVCKSDLPILLIHGTGDSFVPFEMSERISRQSSLVEFHKFEKAGHGLSYITDPERYKEVITAFIKKTLI